MPSGTLTSSVRWWSSLGRGDPRRCQSCRWWCTTSCRRPPAEGDVSDRQMSVWVCLCLCVPCQKVTGLWSGLWSIQQPAATPGSLPASRSAPHPLWSRPRGHRLSLTISRPSLVYLVHPTSHTDTHQRTLRRRRQACSVLRCVQTSCLLANVANFDLQRPAAPTSGQASNRVFKKTTWFTSTEIFEEKKATTSTKYDFWAL